MCLRVWSKGNGQQQRTRKKPAIEQARALDQRMFVAGTRQGFIHPIAEDKPLPSDDSGQGPVNLALDLFDH
jgi:hypothetical protein